MTHPSSPGQWRNAARVCRLGIFNGSSLLVIVLPVFTFQYWYVTALLSTAFLSTELYLYYSGRRLSWVLRKFLFNRRHGVMYARTPRYWRLCRLD